MTPPYDDYCVNNILPFYLPYAAHRLNQIWFGEALR